MFLPIILAVATLGQSEQQAAESYTGCKAAYTAKDWKKVEGYCEQAQTEYNDLSNGAKAVADEIRYAVPGLEAEGYLGMALYTTQDDQNAGVQAINDAYNVAFIVVENAKPADITPEEKARLSDLLVVLKRFAALNQPSNQNASQ